MKASRTTGTVENFAQGYQDYLQAPLQVRFHFFVTDSNGDGGRRILRVETNLHNLWLLWSDAHC